MKLTKPQKLIYDMEKYAGQSIALICGSMLLKNSIEEDVFVNAVHELFRLNDALRIRLLEEDGEVSQYVCEYVEPSVNILRFADKCELDAYAIEYAKEPLDISDSLCDMKVVILNEGCGLLVKLHHLIGDAWTLSLIGTQLNSILQGNAPEVFQYSDYVDSETEYLQSKRYAKDRDFFIEQFKKCDEATYLCEKQSESLAAERKTFVIEAERAKHITEYAEQSESSVFMLFMTALATYINRTKMNAEKFYIGTAVLNRAGIREQNTMGMFINTVPMLIELDNNASFAENMSGIKNTTLSVFRHQKYNYGDVLQDIRREFSFGEKLYDVILSYQNATIGGNCEAETTWYHSGMQSESLQIHIDDRDGEGIFRIHFDYQTEKFTEHEIGRMYEHITNLLFNAVADDSRKLYELEILSADEKQRLLVEFNDTAIEYPREKCVNELFEAQVAQHFEKLAIRDNLNEYSYSELCSAVDEYCAKLQSLGIKKDDVVAIHLNRSCDLIIFQLAVIKAGAIFLPVDKRYPLERIEYMCSDCNIALFISDELTELSSTPLITLAKFKEIKNTHSAVAVVNDTCYIIYTSGSTGKPKGCVLKTSGIINFCKNNNTLEHLSKIPNNKFASVNSVSFDYFIAESLLPLLNGYSVVIFDDDESVNQSLFLRAIKENKVNVLMTTPTKLKIYFGDSPETNILSQISCVCTSGEALQPELLELIYSKAPNAQVFNPLGPSECTVWNVGGELDKKKGIDITIGKPIANTQIYIVDKFMRPTPIGITGELCIAGAGVGAGYLNRPELTAEKFIDNPFGEGKLYKTGDLAYWREDGNIIYVGRNDFQVKIRGLRIELGEIENAISGFDGVSQAVVVVRKNNEGRQLICAFYTGKESDSKSIREEIGKKLPKYMLPHIFTHLDEMPLTASGKINRKALPEVDLYSIDTTAEYVAPQSKQEIALVNAIEAVLGIEKVGILDNFFDLGGDSLKAIELISKLQKLGFSTDTKTVFACNTVKELAEHLTAAEQRTEAIAFEGDIPATPAQMRVYTSQNMNADSTTYNVPYAFRTDDLDPERLQNAVTELINRHEILRTRFENKDGSIIQVIEADAGCVVEVCESDDMGAFIRPFDLSKAPLMRVGYCGNTVMLDMHHIITDGGSMPVFLRELNELYMGRELADEPVQYSQFALSQSTNPESEKYWLSVYSDEPPVLEINTDFKRGHHQTFNGNAVYTSISGELHGRILAKCKILNITPYVFYMSGFNILLSKFSGGEDITVGMPVSGRDGRYLDTIGMFVNTVVLRSKPVGEKTAAEFMTEVKTDSIDAIEYQDYPYGELVKKLNISSGDRNPLFDVMFAYQSEEMTDIVFGDSKAEILSVPITTSKYDFTFNLMPRENGAVLMAEYCTDLFKESTIQRFITGYKLILEQMLDEHILLKDICAVSEQEMQTLLFDFNDTAVEYPRDKCVHELFEEQVAKTPDKTAVIACDKQYTYAELNEEANRIAHSLMAMGINVGDIIAIALPRKSCLIAAMLGVLKAGAAYLPIDPDYPQDRISYMIEESSAKLLITEDKMDALNKNENNSNPCLDMSSENLCYVIFTSGSTGKPKGTAVMHRNLGNFTSNNEQNSYQYTMLKNCKTVLAITTFIFDISVFEIFLSLVNGLEIVMSSDEENVSASALAELIEKHNVDAIHSTPSKITMFIEDEHFQRAMKQLKIMMVGAEVFAPELLERIEKYTDAVIFNGYGPTETTIGSSFKQLTNRSVCVHELFEEQVASAPDNTAVIACDASLTYAELNEQANAIAHSLIDKGVCGGDIVAFVLHRRSYLVAAMFGILKSGAAYLPIDPDYPQDRISYMIEDSKAKFVITDDNIIELLSHTRKGNPSISVKPDSLFCALHTSGSTGTPKMSLLKHSGMMSFIAANKRFWKGTDTVVSATIVTFDAFVMDSVLSVSQGVKLVLASEDDIYNQANFERLFDHSENNMFFSTPTKLESYITNSSDKAYLRRIKSFVVGGEVFGEVLLSHISEHTPESRVYNIYGPTETTICAVVDCLDRQNDITIGKPIANTQIYIVDKNMQPTPIGVTGELCIAGDGVGAGYLNRPELTAEKFIDNPFGEGKLYKTGDLAYWREDGNIVYIGRNDFQIKIRGLRIELGEIENAIDEISGITHAVVVVRKNNEGRQLICAFYTGTDVEVKTIREHIGQKLPKYMMPHIFTHLDDMPLTPSGKVNRKVLPEVDLYNIDTSAEYEAPTTDMQKELCRLMEQVLGTSPIGISDDFFELGGDSLKAIEFVSKAHNEGIYFTLQNVFDYPVVRSLDECIRNGDSQEVSFADVDFSEIDKLLAKNKPEFISEPIKSDVGNLLIAGATGYLGIHILADFLDNDSGMAYCLVRGKDTTDSEKRLAELLEFYFGDKYADMLGNRIVVLNADLQKDLFGMSQDDYSQLASQINTVVNAAASVKHYGSYKYFYEANVETAKRVIEFCRAADAKLIHTSTMSISGNSFADTFDGYVSEKEKHFYESSLYIGQPLDNVYARSKFEAEKAVLDAMTDGLKANIMRMGNLTNRLSDGVFQKNHESNAFLQRVSSVLQLGVFPDYLMKLYAEFTPIDEAASAVMTIARHFSTEQMVFHINSIKVVYMDKLLEYFNSLGFGLRIVSGAEFTEALRLTAKQTGMEHIFETFINDMDENDQLNYDSNIRIENDFTVQYLKSLGFEWADIDYEYICKYIAYFRKIGFLGE